LAHGLVKMPKQCLIFIPSQALPSLIISCM
jgi:hypothetical protein